MAEQKKSPMQPRVNHDHFYPASTYEQYIWIPVNRYTGQLDIVNLEIDQSRLRDVSLLKNYDWRKFSIIEVQEGGTQCNATPRQ